MGDFLLAVVAFLIVLGPLVLIHEFGHFIALRLTGVTVLEFGIGFPPRALKLFERNGTIFSLNWLPIGGFVRPLGEDFVKPTGEESTEKERELFEAHQAELAAEGKPIIKTKSLMEATPLQRIFFLSAGIVMNLIGAFVILVIAAMIGRPTPISSTVTVLSTAKNSPAQAAGLLPGDIITEVNGQPALLPSQLATVMKQSTNRPLNLTIKRGDQTLPITIQPADVPFDAGGNGVSDGIVVLERAKDSPAEAVLQEGDRITKADDTAINSTSALIKYVTDHAGKPITLTVMRGGDSLTISIVPRTNPPAGQGALGISISEIAYDPTFGLDAVGKDVVTQNIPASFGDAISGAWQEEGDIMGRILSAPVQFFRGQLSAQEARPISAVGIAQVSGQILQQSSDNHTPFPILNFAALISIALAVTNLLPIPALDGGRILFVLIEILRGKPMDPEREGMIHLVGLVFLLGLMLILVVNDIRNPVNLILPK